MVNPTSNWVHPADGYKMFEVDPNDLTIENAVEGTSGTAHTTLNDQIANAYTDFLDSTHGVAPITSSNEFQGYPKPTVTATFSEFFNVSTGTDALRVTCTIANKVGFDIRIEFQNLDVDSTVYFATISAGQTVVTNSPLFFASSGNTPINYTMTYLSTGSTTQFTPTLNGSTTGTLTFIEPILRDFSVVAVFYDSDLCLTTTTALDGSYHLGRIWADQTIVCCDTGYTLYKGEKNSNGGNTNVGANVFRIANLSLGFDKIVTNGSGVITSFVQCSP